MRTKRRDQPKGWVAVERGFKAYRDQRLRISLPRLAFMAGPDGDGENYIGDGDDEARECSGQDGRLSGRAFSECGSSGEPRLKT